jgi:hypothetical protein
VSALDISATAARGMIRDWMNKKQAEKRQSICVQRQANGFLKRPSPTKAGEILNLSVNQLRIITMLLTGHCHLKGHLFKLTSA